MKGRRDRAEEVEVEKVREGAEAGDKKKLLCNCIIVTIAPPSFD